MSNKWHIALKLQMLLLTALLSSSSAAANVTSAQQNSVATGAKPLIVASKNFTEAVILGELMTQLLNTEGQPAVHKEGLGGTPMLWKALLAGDIDVFGDYTGTIIGETLASLHLAPGVDLAAVLAPYGVGVSKPLGFNNTYVVGMRADRAAALGIRTISDLAKHPELPLGFCSEFVDRSDGWPMLRDRYGLPQTNVVGMEHEITYRALTSGDIAATNLYSTDAEIKAYHIVGLEDDKHLFARYDAIYLYRLDALARAPHLRQALDMLAGRIDEAAMVRMNAEVKLDHVSEAKVAAKFLQSIGIKPDVFTAEGSRYQQMLTRLGVDTKRHLALVFLPLALNILVGVPLGICAARWRRLGRVLLGTVGMAQTIPSLALLVLLIPLLGVGFLPALAGLFIYGLLPIMKNTCLGLETVPKDLRESADALGLSAMARLRVLELPLASPMILAGIKITAIINVGTATIGAIIGAGGYGETILAGVRHDDTTLLLLGAVPAALLAVLIQVAFAPIERWLIPFGLRLSQGQQVRARGEALSGGKSSLHLAVQG
jgi:osmoprotectant transport system permease protein